MKEITLTHQNFDAEVRQSDRPVLVDFWASWCGPCRMLAPLVAELAEEHDEIKVCTVNVDEQRELAMQFRIMSIPTLILFKDGKPVRTTVGYQDKAELEDFIR